jgi:hypothetical protein
LQSFRRKPESSEFNEFWMPDHVRHDGFETFYELVKVGVAQKGEQEGSFQYDFIQQPSGGV